ncbi:MAG: recombinase RecT [Planctomycetes bacterium]|nr:recombinase RecT [Planctomycetota bacterium]MCB9910523.1 recombinase RecT [Planctomycetota bacterium]MCB9912649.1 recombinase RecT [Planctomycetota bacterium]
MTSETKPAIQQKNSILRTFANRMGLDPKAMFDTLANTIFPTKASATVEQVNALLLVADQYKLNPFTKEIYAFPSKVGGITPVVGVDGWLTLMNTHSQCEYWYPEYIKNEAGEIVGCACVIKRLDRGKEIRIEEWIKECARGTDQWRNMPLRMIRNRAICQGVRLVFGFSGIYEPDEAAQIYDAEVLGVRNASEDEMEALNREADKAFGRLAEEQAHTTPPEEDGKLGDADSQAPAKDQLFDGGGDGYDPQDE